MSLPHQFFIRSAKSRSQKSSNPTLLPALDFTKDYKEDLNKEQIGDRLHKLNANIKVLQRKYKDNLKEGFQHKIKAYRLQAVVQRKLLKQAIQASSKNKDARAIREKYENAENTKNLGFSRTIQIAKKKEERERWIKERKELDKRSMTIELAQHKMEELKSTKEMHDKIVEQHKNVDVKKKYFQYIRKQKIKKNENQTKKQLLERIINNTDVLKGLKENLEQIKSSQQESSNPFLTI